MRLSITDMCCVYDVSFNMFVLYLLKSDKDFYAYSGLIASNMKSPNKSEIVTSDLGSMEAADVAVCVLMGRYFKR